jgi:hypothetical protein
MDSWERRLQQQQWERGMSQPVSHRPGCRAAPPRARSRRRLDRHGRRTRRHGRPARRARRRTARARRGRRRKGPPCPAPRQEGPCACGRRVGGRGRRRHRRRSGAAARRRRRRGREGRLGPGRCHGGGRRGRRAEPRPASQEPATQQAQLAIRAVSPQAVLVQSQWADGTPKPKQRHIAARLSAALTQPSAATPHNPPCRHAQPPRHHHPCTHVPHTHQPTSWYFLRQPMRYAVTERMPRGSFPANSSRPRSALSAPIFCGSRGGAARGAGGWVGAGRKGRVGAQCRAQAGGWGRRAGRGRVGAGRNRWGATGWWAAPRRVSGAWVWRGAVEWGGWGGLVFGEREGCPTNRTAGKLC